MFSGAVWIQTGLRHLVLRPDGTSGWPDLTSSLNLLELHVHQ
jgi:hypothetical protein